MEPTAAAVRSRATSLSVEISDRWILGGLVALGAFVRFFLTALPLQTPFYLPDEYTYSAIARGLAQTGKPVIRDAPAHFPALLEPLLASPFWVTGNPELALRLTQVEHTIAMSLGAVPVYFLCRRLDLGSRIALTAAAVALVSPDLALGSLVVSEPIAFPLVLTAIYAAVVAMSSPSRKAQIAVVTLVALSTFARIQYALLVPVFIVAVLIVARGNVRRAWSTFGLATVTFVALFLVGVASGPTKVLGKYSAVFSLHAPAHTILHQLQTHLVLIPLAAGIVLVPGAIVGLARGLVRPSSPAESAFAAVTTLLAFGLIAQAVLVAATVSGNFGERYVFFFFPLLIPAFALYARHEGSRLAALVLSGAIAVIAITFPLSHYIGHTADSTTLWAFVRLASSSLGVTGAAFVASIGAVALAAVAAWTAWRPSARAPIALAVAVITQALVASAASAWAVNIGRSARSALPADPRWVDAAHLGGVTLVGLPGNNAGAGVEEALWNNSIVNVVRLPHAERFDPGRVLDARVTASGMLVTAAGPVDGPVLVDRVGTWAMLAGARLERTTVGTNAAAFDLWRPTGKRVRFTAEAIGLRADNWLRRSGSITVWPAKTARRLRLRVTLPDPRAAVDTIHFDGDASTSVTVSPQQTRTISFLVPASTTPWTVHWHCDRYGYRNGVEVSFLSAPPQITPALGPFR